ncbi:hypothetical protein GCM10008955_24460 [Deinococcus malanensis]|uniref:Carboxypeptidase regulatory-like domain-containing protein n=2 Tax=Deinococcus malanensis TaxID=1706855 RepID=A0ABQ2EWV4_9DEIO|nr:hypothetical protein GCM10008955_24460 [Deinococcus malanensis]
MAPGLTADSPTKALPAVTLSTTGEALAVMHLPAELHNLPLELNLIGDLPPGIHVTYPRKLPASPTPLLPLSLRVDTPGNLLANFVMTFSVTTPQGVQHLEVPVRWPEYAQLVVQGPAEAAVLPDAPARIPLQVRNTGTGAADVTVTADSGTIESPYLRLMPGEQRTVLLVLPAALSQQTATVTFKGGLRPVTHTLRIRGHTGAGADSAYGVRLRTSLKAESGVTAGVTGSLLIDGRLSRITAVQADIERQASGFKLKSASVTHGETRLNVAESDASNPAGTVGRGAYLAHRWRPGGIVRQVEVGAAVPEQGAARVGMKADLMTATASASVTANVNSQLRDPAVSATGSTGPFSVSLFVAPERSVPWTAAATYRTEAAEVQASASGGRSSWAALDTQWKELPGRPKFGVRADFSAQSLSAVTISGTYGPASATFKQMTAGPWELAAGTSYTTKPVTGRIELKLNGNPGGPLGGVATASGQGQFGVTQWNLLGSVYLNQHGVARSSLKAQTSTPVGAGTVKMEATAATDGALDLAVKGVGYAQALGGQWTLEGGAHAVSLLTRPQLQLSAQATYASPGGWGGFVGTTLPLSGGPLHLKAGLSYSTFLPTTDKLAELLAGPDPSRRTVRVVQDLNGTLQPLANVRISACNRQFQTNERGEATVTGPTSACLATVNVNDLPAHMVMINSSAEVAPGGTVTFRAQPATVLQGQVSYTDPDTGALVSDGPSKVVRVNLTGPEARWTTVQLPGGQFEFHDLAPGQYRVFIDGQPPVDVTLPATGASVIVPTPGPRRTVLDSSAVTPSLRLIWDSVVIQASQAPRLRLRPGAPLREVTVQVGSLTRTYSAATQPQDDEWVLTLPTPQETGSVPVTVTAHFANGTTARRSTHLIVTIPSPP